MTFKVKWPSNAQNRDMGFYYRDGVDLGGFNLPEVNLDTGSSPNIFTLEGTALRYSDTAQYAQSIKDSFKVYDIGSTDCAPGSLGQINTQLHGMFKSLRDVKEQGQKFLDTARNTVRDLKKDIRKITKAIAGILKTLIQRMRNWVMDKLRMIIDNALTSLFPNLLTEIKDSFMTLIINQLFCAFDRIIDGLTKLVGNFLFSLLGTALNAPFCAAERWTNALMNNLAASIDRTLGPIFDKVTDMLDGAAKVAGSVFSMIDKILGFEGLLCKNPECPVTDTFQPSLWGGVTSAMSSANNSFSSFELPTSGLAEGIEGTADQWLSRVGLGSDFDSLSDDEDSYVTNTKLDCYTGNFECGLPQMVLFGGGGSGAVANAVVNNIGETIGVNLVNGGSGYTAPPFVTIADPAGCGENSSAYAEIDSDGTVIDVVIVNPGSGYSDEYNGGAPIITSFVAAPNPITVGEVATISWDVSNADSISLNVDGHSDLGPIGTVYVPIAPDDVTFQPGSDITTLVYTLTARRQNENNDEQITTRDFILTVNKAGTAPPSTGPNTLPPVIDSFFAEPLGFTLPGDIITLTWQTSNTTDVALDIEGYSNIQEDGAVNTIIPLDIEIPTGSGGIFKNYTLTATNDNALGDNKTVTKTIQILIKEHPDSEVIPGTTPTDGSSTTTTGGGVIITPGTSSDEDASVTGDDAPTVSTGVDTSGTSQAGGSGGNGISTISVIDILDTGIGYTADDTVEFINGGGDGTSNGTEASLVVNDLGQIVDLNLDTSGYGFTRIPGIRINSKQGIGAQFRTRLKFIPLNEFIEDQKVEIEEIDPNKLIRVIDCVGKPLTRENIV